MGIAEPFTVIPDPNPEETARLVERLKARRAGEAEVERVEEVTV